MKQTKKPKSVGGRRASTKIAPHKGEVEVKWEREAHNNVPQHVKDQLAALGIEHTGVRKELDALRKTRGKREVGSLKVPTHLQQGIPMDGGGVRTLADIPPGDSNG